MNFMKVFESYKPSRSGAKMTVSEIISTLKEIGCGIKNDEENIKLMSPYNRSHLCAFFYHLKMAIQHFESIKFEKQEKKDKYEDL